MGDRVGLTVDTVSEMANHWPMAGETVICTFRVRADGEQEFRELLERHWPTLRALELVTDQPTQCYRSLDGDGPTYVEIFDWAEGGMQRAHEHPDVLAIWEPMGPLCEERDGRPAMEFPHFEALGAD
jgi:hypothetical protein